MAKRRLLQPWPETVWHTSGRVKNSGALQAIRQRLQQAPFQHWREYVPADDPNWWWGFDATWRTEDGARIKARLELQPDTTAVGILKLNRKMLDTKEVAIELAWRLTAESDIPWCLDWPSPMAMFGDVRPYDWVSGRMPLVDFTYNHSVPLEHYQKAFSSLSAASWYITVVTHDKRPIESVVPDTEPSLTSYLPAALRGRVVEMRVYGAQDQLVNTEAILPDSRLRLKRGGALILPTNPRQGAWPWADYSIRRPSGGDMEQLLKETAEAVARYAALPPHYGTVARWCVEDLREQWELPEIEVAPQRVLEEKRQAEEEVERLGKAIVGLRSELAAECRHGQELLQEKQQAQEALEELRSHPLAEQAAEARQQAERAWAAQEAAEAEAERLVHEVAYLRRQLAQVPGRSYAEPVPERQEGPKSWGELFELAGELMPDLRILDGVHSTVVKLKGHTSERTWLRRAWEALEALQAYAEARAQVGPSVLPHFTAYLDWSQATALISKARWASNEVSLEHGGSDLKVRHTRMFEVPELGSVFMGAHVRVGSGGSPAPRMHLYDDLSGPTGKIWIGYLGPHLPNAKGR